MAYLALASNPFVGKENEAALIRSAQEGNRAAFGQLYERYVRMVHGTALAYVSFHEAEDLVQDVFVRALERLDHLQTPQAFGGWLSTIARNAALDHLRKQRNHVELPADLSASNGDLSEALAVLAQMRTLPEAYRETLILRLVEGLTGAEIAEQTGLTPDSVRVNLHRGMKMLRERLQVSP